MPFENFSLFKNTPPGCLSVQTIYRCCLGCSFAYLARDPRDWRARDPYFLALRRQQPETMKKMKLRVSNVRSKIHYIS